MKSLRTLLKIAKRDLDLLRRQLAEQIALGARLEARIRDHDREVGAEQALAARDYESARAFGGYAARAKGLRTALEGEKDSIEAEIERLRALINEAHVEMRKFERLLELEEAREKVKREKREAAELDEYATLTAGRRAV